jgi:hypothetical protein
MRNVTQNGRPLRVRFQEHFCDYKYANNKSKFTQHLLDNCHSIGPMESIMDVLYMLNKGRLLDRKEIFYIYNETLINNQINNKNTTKPNIIFETIIQEDTSRVHTTA